MGKKQTTEPDIIGGQGPLTKEEESAISKYLADKKGKVKRKVLLNPSTRKKEKDGDMLFYLYCMMTKHMK